MLTDRIPGDHFIFHKLDASLAAQFGNAVSQPGRTFHCTASTSECISVAEREQADVVFCSADPGEYRRLLDALKRRGLPLPVVVVSRIPETSEWLDAMEAGATDYCAAPFERRHVSWLVESALLSTERVQAGAAGC
jgi:DNA-binding NtrC family response regulator